MKESLRQSLDQKLQQRLSPLQMRYVRMLEMTEPEIEEEVRRELDDNPALTEVEKMRENEDEDDTFRETAEEMQLADYRDDDIPSYRLEAHNHSTDDRHYEPVAVAGGESLIDFLMAQLSETHLSDKELSIARYIIGNLDDNGYLTRTMREISDDLAFVAGIEVSDGELKKIFDMIRSLDPPGVGAIDLRDCLVLQLKRLPEGPSRDLALEIVTHYFDLFSHRHFDRLISILHIDRDELRKAEELIKSLDPKPAGDIGESEADVRARHIIPDFIVETDQNGRITISMPGNIPDLTIDNGFTMMQSDTSADPRVREAQSFISRKREEASEFIEILGMRKLTLMKIMEAIAKFQHEFFITEDESNLRPMVLKDIAAVTGYDLSVISRATAGKYVSTTGGIYPLKFFFNERVGDDETLSSREILATLREIIDEEDPKAPLSDDALMTRLHEKGYDIARRTVTKYRERLGLPVARLRKRI